MVPVMALWVPVRPWRVLVLTKRVLVLTKRVLVPGYKRPIDDIDNFGIIITLYYGPRGY